MLTVRLKPPGFPTQVPIADLGRHHFVAADFELPIDQLW